MHSDIPFYLLFLVLQVATAVKDVLPDPFPLFRDESGQELYMQEVRRGNRTEYWPIVPVHVWKFPLRQGWWRKHKSAWVERFEQAWEFDGHFWKFVDFQKDSWKKRILKDKSLRRAIQIDGTQRVLNSFRQLATGMSVKHEGGNVVVAIRGWKRIGKSFLAKILAKLWLTVMKLEYGFEGEVHHVFSVHQVAKILKNCNPGDFIICDESARLTGQGAITKFTNLINLLEITGVSQVGVAFIGPNFNFRSVGGALDLGFEHFGSNFEHEMARAIVYDKEDEPLYAAGFQRNFLHSDFPSYQDEKVKKAWGIMEDEGAEEAFDPEQFEEDVARLLEHAKEEYTNQLSAKRFPRITSLEGDAKSLKIRGNSTYIKNVASRVRDKLEDYVYSLPDEEDEDIQIGDVSEGEAEAKHPLVPFLKAAAEAVLAQPSFRAYEKTIRRFNLCYFDGMSHPEIAELEHNEDPESHRVTANAVGKSVRNLRNKLRNIDIGNIGELAVQKFLESRLPQIPLSRARRCECLDTEDNDHDLAVGEADSEAFVAMNVKLFLSERDGSTIHVSPEFRHDPHCCVVVHTQPEEVRVNVMLAGPEVETEAQAREDGRLVGLEELVRMLTFGAFGER